MSKPKRKIPNSIIIGFLLWLACSSFPNPAQAAISLFGHTQSPADNGSTSGATLPRAITPPASMLANDYVVIIASAIDATAAATVLSISETGGQTWTSVAAQNSAEQALNTAFTRIFHCRFNGTWTANPSVTLDNTTANGFTLWMLVFRGVDTTTALDVAVTATTFTAAADISIAEITTTSANAMAVAVWIAFDDQDWTIQTLGWTVPTPDSLRNLAGSDHSQGVAYKIQAAAGGTGAVVNRVNQGDNDIGVTYIFALKELAGGAAPTGFLRRRGM